MTLEQLLNLENVADYSILWYGYSEMDKLVSEDGLLTETLKCQA